MRWLQWDWMLLLLLLVLVVFLCLILVLSHVLLLVSFHCHLQLMDFPPLFKYSLIAQLSKPIIIWCSFSHSGIQLLWFSKRMSGNGHNAFTRSFQCLAILIWFLPFPVTLHLGWLFVYPGAIGSTVYKMLIVQALRPDRLLAAAHQFVHAVLGSGFLQADGQELDLGNIVEHEVSLCFCFFWLYRVSI